MSKIVKTILVADHQSPSLISLAEHLGEASNDARILIARSPAGALDLARHNQPDIAIITRSFVDTGGEESLVELIRNASPKTQVLIAEEGS